MIEPSGLKIGTIGPAKKAKQPQVNPESDPMLLNYSLNKKDPSKRKNGPRRT